MLMASDALESLGQKLVVGNNAFVSIHPDSKEVADRLFAALSGGGTVEMPMADQVRGDYYGSFSDRFGVQWMINYSKGGSRRDSPGRHPSSTSSRSGF
jgi:PhnB protein